MLVQSGDAQRITDQFYPTTVGIFLTIHVTWPIELLPLS